MREEAEKAKGEAAATGVSRRSRRLHVLELGAAAMAFLRRSARRHPSRPRSAGPARLPGPAGPRFWSRVALSVTIGAATARRAQVGALADTLEQREIVTLLLLPFVLLAFALGMSQTWRHPMRTPSRRQHRVAPPLPAAVEIAPPLLRLPATLPDDRSRGAELPPPLLRVPATPPAIEIPAIELSFPRWRCPSTSPTLTCPRSRRAPAGRARCRRCRSAGDKVAVALIALPRRRPRCRPA